MATVVSKRYDAAVAKIDAEKPYTVEEAISALKAMPPAKFDESVDLSFRLGVDPKHADQMVRGAVVLPHGIGKSVRVAVFAKGEKEREAREAGADVVGAEDLVERVQGGFMDFDTTIATPDLMGQVGRLGKVLGPRGLMPNPKLGTVTFDVSRAVREAKAGKVEFRVDKAGNIHVPVGKRSFSAENLAANAMALIEAIVRANRRRRREVTTHAHGVGDDEPGVKIDVRASPPSSRSRRLRRRSASCLRQRRSSVAELKGRLNGVRTVLPPSTAADGAQLSDRASSCAPFGRVQVIKNRLARLALSPSCRGEGLMKARRA